ncbi:MAG: glycosyltransferase [Actinomyces sp.]|uniref:glycosyltransferase n=1 Tax=Actinomyces sp. TaxID=29317 RepID=UPI0026DD0334|nr:glycosyltransferase [Actinomyces sp.]MDO4242223.1 glycosyltransferase [Actinomyces sp.]
MPRSATGVIGLLARAASSPTGERALVALTLSRLTLARRRGRALDAALEASRRARFLSDRGSTGRAHGLLSAAAARLTGPEQAVLAVEDAAVSLDAAEEPRRWGPALEATLALADASWLAGQDRRTEELLDAVLRLLFHPELHFSSSPSALAEDPVDHLGALHASHAWAALTSPHRAPEGGGSASAEAAGPAESADPGEDRQDPQTGADRPRRVLFVSMTNWNFVRDIVADYRADPRYEVRTLDPGAPGVLPTRPSRQGLLAQRLRTARAGAPPQVPEPVAQDLAWAETIFVEWGAAAAVWVSLVRPYLAPRARLIVRVHSFEASTPWPQLVDWSAVDVLLTVSPAISALLEESLDLPRRLERVTLPNRAVLTDYHLPKTDRAPRTIAMVGWGSVRKDPGWTLDVLDLLRQDDPSWRLLLIGPDFPEATGLTASQARTAAEVHARIERLGQAVTITGQTDVVAEHLRDAAVIVSSSRREGTHEGFIQGVASGALPVCRDWPDVAAWGGPGALFPTEWVVRTPAEAVERIRVLADDHGYREAQARLVLDRWDWSVVRGSYDALLEGPRAED